MKNFVRFLKSFLQRHDPASSQDMEPLRYETLRLRILAQVGVTPQEVKPEPVRRAFRPHMPFGRGAELVLCSLLLLLGLWVGQTMNNTIETTQAAQSQSDETYSVVAMATPWEGWIKGGQ